jgi:hypothetical protein
VRFGKGKCQGKGRREGKVTEMKRGSGVHQRRRISPEMPAGAAEFGDVFRRFQREIARGRKGGEGGDRGGFIGGPGLENGLGFSRGGDKIDSHRHCRAKKGLWPELADDRWAREVSGGGGADGWDPDISGCGTQRRTASGLVVVGPRADSLAGPNGSPRPLYYFFCSFIFLFYFSVLFHDFCITHSNQFIPIPKFFKSSKQYSKPIRNMFS